MSEEPIMDHYDVIINDDQDGWPELQVWPPKTTLASNYITSIGLTARRQLRVWYPNRQDLKVSYPTTFQKILSAISDREIRKMIQGASQKVRREFVRRLNQVMAKRQFENMSLPRAVRTPVKGWVEKDGEHALQVVVEGEIIELAGVHESPLKPGVWIISLSGEGSILNNPRERRDSLREAQLTAEDMVATKNDNDRAKCDMIDTLLGKN